MTVKSNPVKCRAIRHNPGVLNGYAVETIMPWENKKALGKTLVPITLKLWYASAILCLMSYVLCLMSYVLCLMSYVLCLMSYIRHKTSTYTQVIHRAVDKFVGGCG